MRKFLFLIVLLLWGPLQAEIPQGQIHILGDIDESTKQLFIQTITDELHGFTHHVSLQSESSLYVFPYQHEGQTYNDDSDCRLIIIRLSLST